jgi:hypothetical protein
MRFPFWRSKQRQLQQEIAAHLEMAKRDRLGRGASAQQADSAARREFGNVALVEHVTRDQWGWIWFAELLQDFRYGAWLAILGVAAGLLGALSLTRLMSSLLCGVGSPDPSTYAAVALLLVSVAVAASYIPARRAMRVDPVVALRYE